MPSWTAIRLYVWGFVLLVLIAACCAVTYKYASDSVYKKWDAEKIAQQQDQMQLKDQILNLQKEALDKAKAQSEKDALAATQAAQERKRLQDQAKSSQDALKKLTSDLVNNPQYGTCKVDPDTLKNINDRLK